MTAPTPVSEGFDPAFIDAFEMAKEIIIGIRATRNQKGLAPKEALDVLVKGAFPEELLPVVSKLAVTSSIRKTGDFGSEAGVSFMVRTVEVFVVLSGLVNTEEEIAKVKAQIAYQHEFLTRVRAKLANENFVAHAPENVVAMERKKEADSLTKLESLEAQLKALEK